MGTVFCSSRAFPSSILYLIKMQIYQTYKLLSVLNLSHASFSVANTAALIIFCSVVADWES
jgi:hypothetical protein